MGRKTDALAGFRSGSQPSKERVIQQGQRERLATETSTVWVQSVIKCSLMPCPFSNTRHRRSNRESNNRYHSPMISSAERDGRNQTIDLGIMKAIPALMPP